MKDVVTDTIKAHKQLLAQFEAEGVESVVAAGKLIIDCLVGGGCVYTCGNGGSAADAQHIAGELTGRFRVDRKPLAAVALSTDTSVLTCIANDYSFEEVFSRQVEALMGPEDVLWAFSTSGDSPNVVAAGRAAKAKGAKILAFTGKKATSLEKLADVCVCVDAPTTAAAQQIHQLAYHIICDIVERQVCRE